MADPGILAAAGIPKQPLPRLGTTVKPNPLRAAFGLTEGEDKDGGDAAARARIMSGGGGGYLDVLPSERDRNDYNEGPEGKDPLMRVTPTRAQSTNEDAYVGQQIQNTEAADARRRQAIAEAEQVQAQYKRQAMQDEFYRRTGIDPSDPKAAEIALKLKELDTKTRDENKLDDELTALGELRDQELNVLRQQAAGPTAIQAAQQKWDRAMATKLWTYGAARGVNVGNPITKEDPYAPVDTAPRDAQGNPMPSGTQITQR